MVLKFSVVWNQPVGKCNFDVEWYFFIIHIVEFVEYIWVLVILIIFRTSDLRLTVEPHYSSNAVLEVFLSGLKPAQSTCSRDLGLSSSNYKFISSVRLGV